MEPFLKIKPLFQRKRIGLFCDFDGTLSRIVPEPDEAVILPQNHLLLSELKKTIATVAVVSGRAGKDVARLVNIEGLIYIGNHGLERYHNNVLEVLPEAVLYKQKIKAAAEELDVQLVPGMQIENKIVTLSIHYRQTENPVEVQKFFLPIITQTAEKHQLKLFEGRLIFELRPPTPINKGTALHSLIEEYKLDGAVFIGDDITDTAAFVAARALRKSGECESFAIGVIDDGTPQSVAELSDMAVSGVEGVTEFLSWFLENAIASSTWE